jgi:hypothetical protein
VSPLFDPRDARVNALVIAGLPAKSMLGLTGLSA